MSKRSEHDDERNAEWEAGLARLEDLTRQFQQELGGLRQVAREIADAGPTPDAAEELAAPPEEEADYGG